jgi:hypothetical protein
MLVIIMQLGFMAGVIVIMGAMLLAVMLMVMGTKIIHMVRPMAMAMRAGSIFI